MKLNDKTVFIVSADKALSQRCINELAVLGGHYLTPVARSVDEARKRFPRNPPAVVFLDESAIDSSRNGETLESAVALLTEIAPVVVAATQGKQSNLAFLITSGAVDFVARTNGFLAVAAGLLDRRMRMVERVVAGVIQIPENELAGDFGEILRHEVNNPLTGILGNTELLLARRDMLAPAVVERLLTIAELAVRLRETVRRLSNSWDEHHEHAGPV